MRMVGQTGDVMQQVAMILLIMMLLIMDAVLHDAPVSILF